MEIIREADYTRAIKEDIAPAIGAVRTDGYCESFDGTRLFYHVYRAENAARALVLLHGFTESAEKYEEMILYFLKSGTDVYVYDQRCHGKSGGRLADKTVTHVERFSDYVSDLEAVMEKVVRKDLPLYLFAHSMGGAVAGLYMEKHPDTFRRAVLSSPMIAPSTGGYPVFVGRAICRAAILFGGAKKRIFLSSPYPGEERFADSCDTSEPRFAHYEYFKRTHEDYHNYSPSYRWTLESLNVTKKLMKKGEPEKIKTEVLLLSAGLDTVVSPSAQRAFAERLTSCRLTEYPEAKHEIYYSTDGVMDRFVPEVIDFINEKTETTK